MLSRAWADYGLRLLDEFGDEFGAAFEDVPPEILKRFPVLRAAMAAAVGVKHYDAREPVFAGRAACAARAEVASEQGRPASANLAWAELQWSAQALLAGDVARASELSHRSFQTARSSGADLLASLAASQLALLHASAGDPDTAQMWWDRHASAGRARARRGDFVSRPALIATTILALDRLEVLGAEELDAIRVTGDALEVWPHVVWAATQHELLVGEPARMLNQLTYLARLRNGSLDPDGLAYQMVVRCSADLLLALGEFARVRRLLAAEGTRVPGLAVPRARLALIIGDFDAARAGATGSAWDRQILPRDRVELLMIAAAATLAADDERLAITAFSRAHALAAQAGSLMPYLGIAESLREELFRVSGLRLPDSSRDRVAAHRDLYPVSGSLIALSRREETVLLMMAEHDGLRAVAEALTVSINTVKKQATSIYTKLGVHDRRAALLEAARLGMLPPPGEGPGAW